MEPGFYQTYFTTEKKHWWFKVRRNLIGWLLHQYLPGRPEKTKILDYGCGSGYLVGQLQKAGYPTYGKDISPEAIGFGRKQGINNLSVSRDSQIGFADIFFDAVLALDVIEHIEDDEFALKEIERVLKPGGIAIITVPAYMWLWGKQDEVSQHFRRYRLNQLEKLVRQSTNLIPVKKSYFNTFLFPGIVITRLLDKIFKINRSSDFEINNRFLNRLFYNIFNLEIGWLKRFSFPFGVSILLVLGKYE
ncbi:MAG: class I SAM-dependent methyltransferase [Patescibacteria group bacterium]